MNTRSIIWIVIVVILVGGAYYLSQRSTEPRNEEVIKIGAILYLTGDFAPFGTAINQGALLAVENARERGLDVEYISEDDQSTVAGSVSAANKLVSVDAVDGVITATIQEVKPVVEVFNNPNVTKVESLGASP